MLSTQLPRSEIEPATQLTWPQFKIDNSRLISGHRKVLITEPCTPQSQTRLLTQIDDLVSADRRKDESMAVLLHELRSPLAAIQGAMALLRVRSKDESLQVRMHELIERQVRQLALLTAGAGQLSGPNLENLQPLRLRTDLRTVLSRAAETVTSELNARLHQLVVDLPESAAWVLADSSRLEQVFVNLLANASKYSQPRGEISLSLAVCEGHAIVQVSDAGIGIAADSMPYIFDLFVRADAKEVRSRSGMGIGLALVRSILDSHDGTVSAASAGIGQGSEFTVRLKLDA